MAQPDDQSGTNKAVLICAGRDALQPVPDILEAEGYETLEQPHGELDGLTENGTPAIILLDATTAPGDVLQHCRDLRSRPGCEFVPLILLLDTDDPDAAKRAYDVDVTAVFAKPVDVQAFARHVRSIGDTGRTLSGVRALRVPGNQVFTAMPDAFFIAGKDGLLRQYLGGAGDDPLLHPSDIEGHFIDEVWPDHVASEVCRNIKRTLKTRDGCGMYFQLEENGVQCGYEMRFLVQGRDQVLLIVRNLGDEESPPGAGGRQNFSDTLTGLTAVEVFKSEFDELIANARIRERGVAVFCIDIDKFARINDTLGRAVGDAVLQVTAQRIERCLRGSDQLARIDDDEMTGLTRISGDEFVLVLADIESRDDVGTVAGRVRDAFAEPISIDEHQLQITPSIGIAMHPLDGDDAEALLRNARVALDEAKVTSAKGCEFFSNTMKFRAMNRFDVKNELGWAIENEQLELHYLPRLDLRSGQVVGLEALLRWMHPLRGSVPMSEVIPLAEATGLIYPIGEWVMTNACMQAAAWREELDMAPAVSVNLSQQEFSRTDLAELVKGCIESSKLPPEMLELELTEAMLMRVREAETTLQKLGELGVGIVLDDFGKGHSSIAHLTSMPIKAIKIDREFIDGVREPGDQQAICSAMIAMSRELGIAVIAEGVESELQVQFLKDRGCDAVQGFLYTEPLTADKVPGFLVACRDVTSESKIIDLDTVRVKIEAKTGS